MMSKKRLFGIALSLLLFGYFCTKLDVKALLQLIKQVSISWLLLEIVFFFIQLLVKGLRFKHLLSIRNEDIKKLYGIQGTHSVLNYTLPGALGEVSILYLFKKILKIDYYKSTSSLFLLRMIDFLLFAVLFMFLFLFSSETFSSNPLILRAMKLVLLLFVLLLSVGGLFFFSQQALNIFFSNRLLRNSNLCKRAHKFLLNCFSHIRESFSFKSFIYLTFLSVLLWCSLYMVFLARARAVCDYLDSAEVLFIFLAVWPISLLPIRGPANLGTYELGWIVSLSMLGYDESTATVLSFGTHAISMLEVITLSIVLLLVFGKDVLKWARSSGDRAE